MGCLVEFVSNKFVILMSPQWGVERCILKITSVSWTDLFFSKLFVLRLLLSNLMLLLLFTNFLSYLNSVRIMKPEVVKSHGKSSPRGVPHSVHTLLHKIRSLQSRSQLNFVIHHSCPPPPLIINMISKQIKC